MCIKDMISDAASYELDRSISAGIGISKDGTPLKAISVHRNCSTPLWKVVLLTLSVTVAIAMICHLCKKPKCKDNE